MFNKAKSRGFDPNARPCRVLDEHIKDAPRSGRPTKQTPKVQEEVLKKVRRDRYGREKTCDGIAIELRLAGIYISRVTVWRILRIAGLKKTKPTRKLGLTAAMKTARL
jgi:transposase